MATRKAAAKAAKTTAQPKAAEPDKPSSEPLVGEPGAQPEAAEGAALLSTGGDFTPLIATAKLTDEELAELKPGPIMVMPAGVGVVTRIEAIAKVCHEANRALCVALGDDSQKPWAEAADWQRDSAIKGVQFAMDNPDADPAAQHAAWCRDKINAGWAYGPVKDEAMRQHPCLVAYELLPVGQKAKDHIFRAIVQAMLAG